MAADLRAWIEVRPSAAGSFKTIGIDAA